MQKATLMVLLALAAPPLAADPDAAPSLQEAPAMPVPAATDPTESLARWITDFRPRALAEGISAATFDAAFAGVTLNETVLSRDRNQNEFTKTIWDYLATAVSDDRIASGRAALARHGQVLDAIEARYGVDKHVVVAIWGLESAYGAVRGDTPIIEAMATLAHDGRRGAFYEAQLLAALRILDSGVVTPDRMRGSWAGAMGHTQFMPTSYEALAVDFTGDGRRDIWGDDPTDALASTAAYLAANGWVTGQPWGVEVRLPEGFDYLMADRAVTKSPALWAALGVRDTAGRAVPLHGRASVLLPGGARGAAFMIFDNFRALESYNTADAYVIAVGHLADRLRGGGPIVGTWPDDDRALTFAERQEMQALLTRAGFDTRGVDGLVGPNTINAIRGFQQARGHVPDGYASLALLTLLQGDAAR